MKFDIPKITRRIELADYAPEMAGNCIHVWVNPPRDVLIKYQFLLRDTIEAKDELDRAGAAGGEQEEARRAVERINQAGDELYTWFASIWSQGEDDGSRWTVEEVRQLSAHSLDTDPGLWSFVTRRTHELIVEHRQGQKKASKPA